MNSQEKRLVVGISGASGMVYAVRLMQSLPAEYKIHLIISKIAQQIMKAEIGIDPAAFTNIELLTALKIKAPDRIQVHSPEDHWAAIASGSYKTEGMVVIPCSMKTLSGIANSYTGTLMERAADVVLKEKRKLVLVVRETPLNRIHMQNMLKAHDAGATILPATPGFYHNPQTIDDLVDFIAARTLNALNIEQSLYPGWREL